MVAPPDAFSLRTRDIIKVFIVTPAHCCEEFFRWVGLIDRVCVDLQARETCSDVPRQARPDSACLWICIVDARGCKFWEQVLGRAEVRVGGY